MDLSSLNVSPIVEKDIWTATDQVMQHLPLLEKIMFYVNCRPHDERQTKINPSLRLLSSHFNNAVLKSMAVPKLHLWRTQTEREMAELDGRMCKNMALNFQFCGWKTGRHFCYLREPSPFSGLIQLHGESMQFLDIRIGCTQELSKFMMLVNSKCPNLRRITLHLDYPAHEYFEDWIGHFQNQLHKLMSVEVKCFYGSSTGIAQFAAKVLCSFFEATPNLENLVLDGDLILKLHNIRELKKLKCTVRHDSTKERTEKLVDMLNTVASTLESLELYHRCEADYVHVYRVSRCGPIRELRPLSALKSLTIGLFKPSFVPLITETLWHLMMSNDTMAVENITISIEGSCDGKWFWDPLSVGLNHPFTTVKTLKIHGSLLYPLDSIHRLRTLQMAFPELTEIEFHVTDINCFDVIDLMQNVLRSLREWNTQFKKVILNLEFNISLQDMTTAFQATGEDFFSNGLERLTISQLGAPWNENETIPEAEMDRMLRILTWTKHLQAFMFRSSLMPRRSAGLNTLARLVDYKENNHLPVFFSFH